MLPKNKLLAKLIACTKKILLQSRISSMFFLSLFFIFCSIIPIISPISNGFAVEIKNSLTFGSPYWEDDKFEEGGVTGLGEYHSSASVAKNTGLGTAYATSQAAAPASAVWAGCGFSFLSGGL